MSSGIYEGALMAKNKRRKTTPPKEADRLGINPDKVLGWFKAGELRAINAASRPNGRPRYLIDESDIEAFEARRAVNPTVRPQRRRRRRDADIVEFV